MTSELNHDDTVEFFQQNIYFGAKPDSIKFFQQGTLPAFDSDGKIILESKTRVSASPNGNGGVFDALAHNENIRSHIKDNKIEYLQVVGVDNVLNKLLDPLQIGMSVAKNLDVNAKSVVKAEAGEKVGVFALKNGKYDLIEYSELGTELAESVDEDGNLLYD